MKKLDELIKQMGEPIQALDKVQLQMLSINKKRAQELGLILDSLSSFRYHAIAKDICGD